MLQYTKVIFGQVYIHILFYIYVDVNKADIKFSSNSQCTKTCMVNTHTFFQELSRKIHAKRDISLIFIVIKSVELSPFMNPLHTTLKV